MDATVDSQMDASAPLPPVAGCLAGATRAGCRAAWAAQRRNAARGSRARTAPAPAPEAAPAPAPSGDYTVYFDFDSWTLTAEDLTTITNAVDAARKGGQSHIKVVGHTDTSGSADYNSVCRCAAPKWSRK